MKKILCTLLSSAILMGALVGCGSSSGSGSGSSNNGFDKQNEITVVSREDGSGTRGAFIELLELKKIRLIKQQRMQV